MSIRARIIKLEAAPRRDKSLSDRIAGARAYCAARGVHFVNTQLTDEEEQQIKGRGLAERLCFFRERARRPAECNQEQK